MHDNSQPTSNLPTPFATTRFNVGDTVWYILKSKNQITSSAIERIDISITAEGEKVNLGLGGQRSRNASTCFATKEEATQEYIKSITVA